MPYGTLNTGTITPGSGNTLTINEPVDGTAIKDQDNMSSNSATHLATQQSIKAYVDTAGTNSSITTLGTVTAGSIGSAVTGFTGVKMVDIWRMTADMAFGNGGIFKAVARMENHSQGSASDAIIGGSIKMVPDLDSGYWTFPTIGVYECICHVAWKQYNTNQIFDCLLKAITIENFGSGNTENLTSIGGGSSHGADSTGRGDVSVICDVTNVSTFRVMFRYDTSGASGFIIPEGDGTVNETWFQFIRLGD